MKLPEDKKQRTQVLVLIGMGAILILVGIYFGISFVKNRNKAIAKQSADLTENIRKANLDTDKMSSDRKLNAEALRRIKDLDKYLLKPRIGNNYLLSATEVIETITQRLKLDAPTITPMGLSDIASGGRSGPVRAYSAHVVLVCNYNDLIRLIRAFNEENPLLSILNISISGRLPPNVETHSIGFDVQWPVWADQDMPAKLDAQIAAQAAQQEKR